MDNGLWVRAPCCIEVAEDDLVIAWVGGGGGAWA